MVGLGGTVKTVEPWNDWVGRVLKDHRAIEWLGWVGRDLIDHRAVEWLGWKGP